MRQVGFDFEVLVYGQPVREYQHKDGKTYVEGRGGSQFTLRVRNNLYGRILAVITVDGLSVMDGKEGSIGSGGYVIDSHGLVGIPGWRLDNDAVAHFLFDKSSKSYAATMGKPTNVGVIGCAIFEEKKPIHIHWPRPPVLLRKGSSEPRGSLGLLSSGSPEGEIQRGEISADPGTVAPASVGNLGAGFGERTEHRVVTVKFERATSFPVHIFEIRYDDRAGLEARGIDLRGRPQVSYPDPFPADKGVGCTPPPDWRG